MKALLITVVTVPLTLVLLTASAATAQSVQNGVTPPHTVKEARGRIDSPVRVQATSVQQVAILTLYPLSDGGARLGKVQVSQSIPPKSFARNRGDWEVRLSGDHPSSYRIQNPFTDVEIENPGDAQAPFSQVRDASSTAVPLIVPLSHKGRSLGVKTIQITDLTTGRIIVETEVPRQ